MTDLSIGTGLFAAVVFIVFVGLSIFSILLLKDLTNGAEVAFNAIAFSALTVLVGIFLASILGFINIQDLL
jgi:hypothetical protein